MEPTSDQGQVFGLIEVVRMIGRRWRWVVGTVVVVMAIALALSLQQSPKYTASARLLLRTVADPAVQQTDPNQEVAFYPDRQVKNALQLMTSGEVQVFVDERYDGPLNVGSVTATALADGSDAVSLSASATDPDEAADLVNSYAQAFIEFSSSQRLDALQAAYAQIQVRLDDLANQRAEAAKPLTELDSRIAANPGNEGLQAQRAALAAQLEAQLNALDQQRAVFLQNQQTLAYSQGLAPENAVQLLTAASPPSEPVSPKPVRDGVIGLMLGLGLGVTLALVREFLDESIRTSTDLEQVLRGRYPVLGVIPLVDDGSLEEGALLPVQSPIAEAYRSLRTSVRFSEIERPMKVIQITSPSPGEGKTTTAANLARVLSQAGHRVAAACCDLRRPRIHLNFGVSPNPGMADVVLGEHSLQDALRVVDGIYVLPAGTTPPNPSELLGTLRAQRVMDGLAQELDFVIVDSTPVLAVTDAIVVSRFVDATIVVVSAGDTTRRQVQETLKSLELSSAPIIGFVLNRAGAEERNLYGYSYAADGYEPRPGKQAGARRGLASTSSS